MEKVMKMYINTNLYLNLIQCPRLFLHNLQKQKKPYIDGTLRHQIHEYIQYEYSIKDLEIEDAFNHTIDAVNHHHNFGDGLFLYKDCYTVIDALKYTEEGYELYFVRGGTKLRKEFKYIAAYSYYLLNKLGIKVSHIYMCTINNQYVKYGKVDPRLLFNFNDVTLDVMDLQDETKKNIHTALSLLEADEVNVEISTSCLKGIGCSNKDECFNNLPTPNIFDIVELEKNKAFEYYQNNIITYQDVLDHKLPLTLHQTMQIESYVYHKDPIMNIKRLNYFFKQLKYPLYFLDFETFQIPVPLYDGTKPYESIPFQYSLHILEENGSLKHLEFLADGNNDPRHELAKSLVNNIPSDACIIAYNNHLEKTVVMSLAILFEDTRDHLLNMYPHIYDLEIPFKNYDYYHKDTHGNHSIKTILPALCPNDPSLDYHYLEGVHNGSEAMFTYTKLKYLNEKEKEETRKNLLKYCELDTLAMVKIYQRIMNDLNNI